MLERRSDQNALEHRRGITMAKGSTYANDLLKHIFQNAAIPLVGDASGLLPSATAGSLYVSLHTADPGVGGSQTTSEANYTGYARVAVARTSGGWTVSGNQASNTAAITFGLCTAGSNTIGWFAVGTDSSGAGKVLYSFPLVTAYFTSTGETTASRILAPGSTFSANDPVIFGAAPAGSMPSPLVVGTIYFVKTVLSADSFTVSATSGGTLITITADGAAMVGRISTLAISSGITPAFAVAALTVSEF
jgi:hypothetical protein